MAVNHPSTCQCGGSGKIVEWEKEFDRKMSELGQLIMDTTNGNGPDDPEDIAVNWKEGMRRFIRSLLASHSQALQERHEAEIKRRRDAIVKCLADYRAGCSACKSWGNTGCDNHHTPDILAAFDSATHLNPKS